MGQVLLFAVGGGVLSAMLFVSAAYGSPAALITTYFTPLPLYLVGFSLGAAAAGVAGVMAVLVAGLLTGASVAGSVLVAFAMPVALLMRRAMAPPAPEDDQGPRQAAGWCPPGPLLVILCGYAVALIAAAAVTASGTAGGLAGLVEELTATRLALLSDLTGGEAEVLAALLVGYAPGIVATGWMGMMVLNGIVGQWIVDRFGLSRRPPMAMSDIELPGWTVAVFAILVAAAYLLDGQIGYVARNLAVVAGVGFFFAGLGVVHALLRRRPSRPLWLAAFYGLLVLQGWTALAVAGLGVIEQWAGLRRRVAAAGGQMED